MVRPLRCGWCLGPSFSPPRLFTLRQARDRGQSWGMRSDQQVLACTRRVQCNSPKALVKGCDHGRRGFSFRCMTNARLRYGPVAPSISRSSLDSRLSAERSPPFQGLRDTLALPSGVLGPVLRSHGLQVWINCAARARRSGVQPFMGLLLKSARLR